MLPKYKSTATPEQREQKMAFMYFQLKMIKEQVSWKMDADKVTVKCGCHKKIKVLYAHRCFYCEIYYCIDCAQEHFSMSLPTKEDKSNE